MISWVRRAAALAASIGISASGARCCACPWLWPVPSSCSGFFFSWSLIQCGSTIRNLNLQPVRQVKPTMGEHQGLDSRCTLPRVKGRSRPLDGECLEILPCLHGLAVLVDEHYRDVLALVSARQHLAEPVP